VDKNKKNAQLTHPNILLLLGIVAARERINVETILEMQIVTYLQFCKTRWFRYLSFSYINVYILKMCFLLNL